MTYFYMSLANLIFVLSVIGVFAYFAVRFAVQDGGDLLRHSLKSITGSFDRIFINLLSSRLQPDLKHLRVQQVGAHAGIAAGQVLPLAVPITAIGRSSDNHIRLNVPEISGKHASLSYERGGWWLKDRNSRNGTFLHPKDGKSQPVGNDPVQVHAGDVIQLGPETRLQLIP